MLYLPFNAACASPLLTQQLRSHYTPAGNHASTCDRNMTIHYNDLITASYAYKDRQQYFC